MELIAGHNYETSRVAKTALASTLIILTVLGSESLDPPRERTGQETTWKKGRACSKLRRKEAFATRMANEPLFSI
jgi:hypothetical protein